MNNALINAALIRFTQEFAARHDMPEISRPVWVAKETKDGSKRWDSDTMDVMPKGQMVALVSTLRVKMTAWYDKYLSVEVRLNYDHPSGGSNGDTRSYRILVEEDSLYGAEAIRYHGYISNEQNHFISAQNSRIMRESTKA